MAYRRSYRRRTSRRRPHYQWIRQHSYLDTQEGGDKVYAIDLLHPVRTGVDVSGTATLAGQFKEYNIPPYSVITRCHIKCTVLWDNTVTNFNWSDAYYIGVKVDTWPRESESVVLDTAGSSDAVKANFSPITGASTEDWMFWRYWGLGDTEANHFRLSGAALDAGTWVQKGTFDIKSRRVMKEPGQTLIWYSQYATTGGAGASKVAVVASTLVRVP